jgi:hypothetical protein
MAKMAELHAEQTTIVCTHDWRQAVTCATCRELDKDNCPLELCVECGELVGDK